MAIFRSMAANRFKLTASINAVIVTLLTIILHAIGMASPYWTTIRARYHGIPGMTVTLGLWKACVNGTCISGGIFSWILETIVIFITKILICVAMGVKCLCLILIIMATRSCSRSTKRCILLFAGLLLLLAGCTTTAGCVLYGISMRLLGWAFGVTCAAAVLTMISAIITFVARSKTTDQRFGGVVIGHDTVTGQVVTANYPPGTTFVSQEQPAMPMVMQYQHGETGQAAYSVSGQMPPPAYPTGHADKVFSDPPPPYQ